MVLIQKTAFELIPNPHKHILNRQIYSLKKFKISFFDKFYLFFIFLFTTFVLEIYKEQRYYTLLFTQKTINQLK